MTKNLRKFPYAKYVCTLDSAGVLDPEANRPAFHPDVKVPQGAELEYIGPDDHTEGWHLFWYTDPEDRRWVVPLGDGMFEVVKE